jgi:thioredoxin reductase
MLSDIESTPNVITHFGLSVTRIMGEQFVTGVEVRDGGGTLTVPLDGVFVLLGGNAPVTDFLAGAISLSESGCISVDCDYATNIPGVYAVGDVTCLHPNQAIIAAGGGVVAALAIDRYLSGRKRTKVDYM